MVYYRLYRPDIGSPLYIRARHVQIINGCAIFHRDDVNEPVLAIGAGWWQSFTEVDEDLKPTCVQTDKELQAKMPQRTLSDELDDDTEVPDPEVKGEKWVPGAQYTGHAADCPIRIGKPCAPHCQMHHNPDDLEIDDKHGVPHPGQERATSVFPDNKDEPTVEPPEPGTVESLFKRMEDPAPGDDKKVFDLRHHKSGKPPYSGEV